MHATLCDAIVRRRRGGRRPRGAQGVRVACEMACRLLYPPRSLCSHLSVHPSLFTPPCSHPTRRGWRRRPPGVNGRVNGRVNGGVNGGVCSRVGQSAVVVADDACEEKGVAMHQERGLWEGARVVRCSGCDQVAMPVMLMAELMSTAFIAAPDSVMPVLPASPGAPVGQYPSRKYWRISAAACDQKV